MFRPLVFGLLSVFVIVQCAQNICKEGVFVFEGFRVNGFQLINGSVKLQRVGDYLLDDELKFETPLFNTSTASALRGLKERYQSYIMKVYSEYFLNSKTEFQRLKAWKDLVVEVRHQFNAIKELEENKDALELLEAVEAVCDRGLAFIDYLMLFKDNKLSEQVISRDQFIKELNGMPVDHNNEELVFQHKLLSYYFTKPLLKMTSFKLHRYSKLFYDPRSFGEIAYSIYVPISIMNPHQTEVCSKSNELPLFFSLKGKV